MTRAGVVIGTAISLVVISGSGRPLFAETPGERFENAMKQKAEYCTTHKILPGNRRCDILKLKPAEPLATEEGRFAHSIKIPNSVPEDSGYKPGMTPEQYFDHLCKTEAGEFIYKTVENVEGLYMMRPRKEATDNELQHLYVLEDPYGQVVGAVHSAQDYYVQPALGKYQYLEMPFRGSQKDTGITSKYKRYHRDENAHPGKKYQTAIDGRGVFVPYIVAEAEVETTKSRYGYTWRGISRPHDRELGIAGGELLVLDMKTNEVLAVRRGYIRSGWMKNLTSIWWLSGQACPNSGTKQEHLFVKEALKPVAEPVVSKEE
jgi:hypothetical protein